MVMILPNQVQLILKFYKSHSCIYSSSIYNVSVFSLYTLGKFFKVINNDFSNIKKNHHF